LLYTKDVTEGDGTTKQKIVHEGPVFDVVDINWTAETKDTQRNEKTANKAEDFAGTGTTPSMDTGGRQYIRIYSRAIINALQCFVNYYPYRSIVRHPVEVNEPYAILVHHWDLLKEFRNNFHPDLPEVKVYDCEVNDTYEHLGYLLDWMEMEMREKVEKEYERWKQPVRKVSFEMLWLLLKPGTDVYCDEDDNGSKEPYVVTHVSFNILNETWNSYEVKLWQLEGDEDSIQPVESGFHISRFHGEKNIHELDIFPCEYLPDNDDRTNKMIERGKLFFKLRQRRCTYYDGEGDDFPRVPVSTRLSTAADYF
jgi:hypothetical protein